MTDQLYAFDVAVPAGTPIDAPALTAVAFPPRTVAAIDVRIPPGPNGLLGWRLTTGGVQVIPYTTGDWIVANDEHFHWTLDGLLDSGAWQVQAYNLGAFPHTIYLRFTLTPTNPPGAPAPLNPQVMEMAST